MLLKPCWALSSGSARSQLDPVLFPSSPSLPLLQPPRRPVSLQLGWQFSLPRTAGGTQSCGWEETSHSAPGTAESVLLHLTAITKPTTTRDLF